MIKTKTLCIFGKKEDDNDCGGFYPVKLINSKYEENINICYSKCWFGYDKGDEKIISEIDEIDGDMACSINLCGFEIRGIFFDTNEFLPILKQLFPEQSKEIYNQLIKKAEELGLY